MDVRIMTDSPIRFPGLFGDWTFTASSKAIDVGHGVYWYGILIALGLLLAAYLVSVQAYGSLSPLNLLIFLITWLAPVWFLSGWVHRY